MGRQAGVAGEEVLLLLLLVPASTWVPLVLPGCRQGEGVAAARGPPVVAEAAAAGRRRAAVGVGCLPCHHREAEAGPLQSNARGHRVWCGLVSGLRQRAALGKDNQGE